MTTVSPHCAGTGLLLLMEERIRLATGNRVRGLRVEVDGAGGIRLQGQVATRHAKQLALHAALEFVDGAELLDRVEVV